jgi:hypothetical protein
VDDLTLRGDGVAVLDVRVVLQTDHGVVAVRGCGVGTLLGEGDDAGIGLTLLTAPALAWLNRVLAVALTRSNRAASQLRFRVYTVEED